MTYVLMLGLQILLTDMTLAQCESIRAVGPTWCVDYRQLACVRTSVL